MCALAKHTEVYKNTFRKSERLYKQKDIQELFDKGSSFFLYPFTVRFFIQESFVVPQLLIAVPKKRLKKAVSRNLVKRRVKEVYRQNKHSFIESLSESNLEVRFALVYASNKIEEYNLIENKLSLILTRLQEEAQLFTAKD